MAQLILANASATEAAGAKLTSALGADADGAVVYLQGPLGAGKTTLVRGLLAALGHPGRVKSPTYTLMERYDVEGRCVWHLDLYRIAAPGELAYLGLDELDPQTDLVLIEWPERGADKLPAADLIVSLGYLEAGRKLQLQAQTERGQVILKRFEVLVVKSEGDSDNT